MQRIKGFSFFSFFLQKHVLMCMVGKDYEVRTLCGTLLDVEWGRARGAHWNRSTCSDTSQLAAAAPTGPTRD